MSRLLVSLLALLTISGHSPCAEKPTQAELDAAFLKGRALVKEGKQAEAIPFYEKAAELAPAVFGDDHPNTAAILDNLGRACLNVGAARKATGAFGASLKIREKVYGPDDVLVSESLFFLAAAERGLGNYAAAAKQLERSLQICDAKLPKDHPDIEATLNDLAATYKGLGRLDEAEPLWQRAIEMRERRLGKDHPAVANLLNNCGTLYVDMGRFRDAETLALRCVKILEARFGKDSAELEIPVNTLSIVYQHMGRFAEAETFAVRGLRLREARLPKDHPELATALNTLGLLYMDTRRFALAEAHFLRALAIIEAKLGPDHLHVASTSANLAQLYHNLGRLKEAETLYGRALEIREKRLGTNHPDVAGDLTNLGALYAGHGRHAEALPLLERAVAIAHAKLGPDHPETGNYLHNLGSAYLALKQPEKAEGLFLRALKIAQAKLGLDHPNLLATYQTLGAANMMMGRFKEAKGYFERQLAMSEKLGSESPASLAYRCLAGISFLEGRQVLALEQQDKAMRLSSESLRRVFAFSSEAAMHGFLGTLDAELPTLIGLAAAGGSDAGARLALDWTLRRKGVVFDAVCRFRQLQDRLAHDDPLSKPLEDYRALKKRIADATLTPPTGKDAEAFKKELERWNKELLTLESELNRGLTERFSSGGAAIDSAAVRKALAPKTALVEFVRSPLPVFKHYSFTSPHYFAFVLLPGDAAPRLIDLGAAAPIDKGVAVLRQEFTEFQEKLKDCESDEEIQALEKKQAKLYQKTGQELQALVFAPLRKALGDSTLIYVAPDGELNRIPFEALVSDDGKYLVEQVQFAYLASGRDLLRPAGKSAKGTVIFANPDFRVDAAERRETVAKLLGKKAPVELALSRGASDTRSAGWKPLPGAAAEARDIEKVLTASDFGPVKRFDGPQALEEVLKSMPPPRVLHLATHGFFVDREPDGAWKEGAGAGWARGRLKQMDNPLLRSGIVLAGANTVGDKDVAVNVEDGWVTAEEIALLNLSGNELVVLSACQTGLGDVRTGEGVSGLRWAFLYAGARTLVTSLFEVPDAETRQLMKHFYTRLPTHSKIDALHGAQRALIQERRASHGAAHPFFWASFVLVGDPK